MNGPKAAIAAFFTGGLALLVAIVWPHLPTEAARPDKAAATLTKLRLAVDMPFRHETPLADVLKYIKSATTDSHLPDGLPIYVDPRGMDQAGTSEDAPIRINLMGMPLEATLPVMLDQLGLVCVVRPDGLVVITSADRIARFVPTPIDASLFREAEDLRSEVESLRTQVAELQIHLRQHTAQTARSPMPVTVFSGSPQGAVDGLQ